MRLIKNTTELIGIGIKNQNIIISLVFETDTHNDKLFEISIDTVKAT